MSLELVTQTPPLETQISPEPRATTSASNLFRRFLCPGSHWAEMGILDEESEYSAEGVFLHAFALNRVSKAAPCSPEGVILTADQSLALDEAERLFKKVEEQTKREFGITDDDDFIDEVEITLEVFDGAGNLMLPGHADIIRTWIGKGVRLIVDFKMLFGKQTEAAENWQLCAYDVGAFQAFHAEHTVVAIAAPRVFGERMTMAVYTEASTMLALEEIERIHRGYMDPFAKRIPGEKQCAHCKAKLFCGDWKAQNMLAPVPDWTLVSPEQLGDFITRGRQVAAVMPKLLDIARKLIPEGQMPGWKLQSTGETKTITDLIAFFVLFVDALPDVPASVKERFMRCLRPSWGDLTDLAAELMDLPPKKARARLEEIGAGLIVSTPKEASPKRIDK